MDSSEDFCFEVPIVNLEDVGILRDIKNPKNLVKESSEADNDCSIVEPENVTTNRLNFTSSVNEVYHKKNEPVKEHKKTCLDQSAPIVIDVDSEKDADCSVIDNDPIASNKNIHPHSESIPHQNTVYFYDELLRENPLLIELIEKCLDMENSAGMLRVINRTLIPIYKDVDKAFKESDTFKKLVSQNIMKLDTDPDKKFSHIKGLCEILKTCKAQKKRASLITLKRNLNGKFSSRIPSETIYDVIDLDDDDDDDDDDDVIDCNDTDIQINDARVTSDITDEKSTHNLNDCGTRVEINDTENDSNIQINPQSDSIDDDVILVGESDNNSNKENKTISRNNIIKKRAVINNTRTAKKRRQNLNSLNNNESTQIDLSNDDERAVINPMVQQNDHKLYVDYLEKEIAKYNEMVKLFEEAEVASDDLGSPYVQCELYKSKVVSLYKELCKLTGTEPVKRHKVRLKVVPGHPEGPVRCLEEFINKNIDENGNPPFPDLHDVIKCVQIANMQYQMGWSKKQIEDEARALFIHYGQNVQKRRQKREWRHLLTYVKEEAPDPADVDSALQARLLENAKVAKKNEKDLLDKYAHMDNPLAEPVPGFELSIEHTNESEEDSDYGSTSPIHGEDLANNTNSGRIRLNSYIESCKGNITENVVIYNPCSSLKQKTADATYPNNTVNQNLQATTDVIASKDHNYEVLINNPECSGSNITDREHNLEGHKLNEKQNREVILHKDSTYILDVKPNIDISNSMAIQVNEVTTNLDEKTVIANDFEGTVNAADNNKVCNSKESDKISELQYADAKTHMDLDEVVVKREPLDIPRMLEELGDNYTATIIDIEDPFLVIEISDSSESEDEDGHDKY